MTPVGPVEPSGTLAKHACRCLLNEDTTAHYTWCHRLMTSGGACRWKSDGLERPLQSCRDQQLLPDILALAGCERL